MLPKGKVLVGFLLLMLGKNLFSQQQKDSIVVQLPTIEITENKLTGFAAGKSVLNIDKEILSNSAGKNLSEILSNNSTLNIRSYGPNGAASISMRGTNSNHTAVLWNGINIQDPLNGTCNTSLIPAFFSDEIQLVSGGISALYGSGSIGGLINLQNTANFVDKFRLEIMNSMGSFSSSSNAIKMHAAGKKYASNIKFFNRSAMNDFKYTNFYEIGDPVMKLTHAYLNHKAVSQENVVKMGAAGILSTAVMYQKVFREIPPMMSEASSRTTQGDQNLRALAQYSQGRKWVYWNIKSALLASEIVYDEPDIILHAIHQSYSNVNEISAKIKADVIKSLFHAGFNNTFEKAKSGSLQLNSNRNRLAFFGSIKTDFLPKLECSANFRDELVNSKWSEPTYAFYLLLKAQKSLQISTSFTRNYRVPTFNELYWKDSHAQGNLHLKDESGYSGDLNLEYFFTANKMNTAKVSLYSARIDNMIQWLLNGKIYQPYNQQQIKTKGLEISLKTGKKSGKFEYKSNASYEYVSSTLVDQNMDLNGHQLVFIPKHSAHLDLRLNYHGLEIFAAGNFMSARSVSYAINDSLPALFLANLGINFTKKLKSTQMVLGFRVNNLLNTEYQMIPNYPNPGRNFEVNFNYIFNLKNND